MLTFYLNIFRSRIKPPQKAFWFGVSLIKLIFRLRKKSLQVDFDRFASSQWLQSFDLKLRKQSTFAQPARIDLVFVVTKKDFSVLEYSLPMAIKSISDYEIGDILLIVPSQDVRECDIRFSNKSNKVRVINEETLISAQGRKVLSSKFNGRYTWVLQQLLKIIAVLGSDAEAVLVVDADTILLRKRKWINESGQQLLQPSEEFNSDYYSFLAQFGISKDPPEFSLVSHHMIIQPRILKEAVSKLGVKDVQEIPQVLKNELVIRSESPVCVDYELYGQYMLNFRREDAFLEQWANIGIPVRYLEAICNSRILILLLKPLYNSVSFHSWS